LEYEPVELKFSSQFIVGQSILLCPQCSFEYLHVTKVAIHRGSDKTTIVKDKITIEDNVNTSRGVTIAIEYLGECGHRGEIVFQFYKGNVEVFHRYLPIVEHGDIEDIFRD